MSEAVSRASARKGAAAGCCLTSHMVTGSNSVSVFTRLGLRKAKRHATAPPYECPTRCTGCRMPSLPIKCRSIASTSSSRLKESLATGAGASPYPSKSGAMTSRSGIALASERHCAPDPREQCSASTGVRSSIEMLFMVVSVSCGSSAAGQADVSGDELVLEDAL
jgi:hypothetical protein